MSSEAQVNANRKNALKSTGPRMQEGKDVSLQNVIKHGQACPEQSRRDDHATNTCANEPNFEDEASESHPHPDKNHQDRDATRDCTNEANLEDDGWHPPFGSEPRYD